MERIQGKHTSELTLSHLMSQQKVKSRANKVLIKKQKSVEQMPRTCLLNSFNTPKKSEE
eukprot:TRINITY_DN5128_c0_g1_i1.p2 TRINITY_DN5128_c0_g1~~TRINITY_DN5128_c0_g1_i1.p2  ORF type:complete len:59 (-),score=7.60 TRINITY_DN5128_c0_g1_i1:448-624(-)